MKEIQLTQGKVALVDDEDFEWLNQWRWLYVSVGYAARMSGTEKRKMIYMHTMILNTPKGMEGDHINADKLDNRRLNLRNCSHAENNQNNRLRSNNTSGYKGVSRTKSGLKWRAYIKYNYKRKHLGEFDNIEDAARAYDAEAIKLFGEFAHSNF